MKWVVPAYRPKKEELIDFILKERGISDTELFLNPEISHLHDPFLMYGMDNVVDSILEAIKRNKKIVIHGDFDVDGVTGTSIMWDFLYRELGADVTPLIPNRFTDGYGLSEESIIKAKEIGAKVIITVDCGIKDIEIVEKYKDDFQFIITDHHTLLSSDEAKDLDNVEIIGDHAISKYVKAATHPGLNNQYPFKEICGSVVSWKVCSALNIRTGNKVDINKYLDLAMLGTVCDIMPLRDENRVIVKYGLERLRKTENAGLRALMNVAGADPSEIQSYHIGYVLGPRLNAAGRIEQAMDAVRLLTTKSKDAAYTLAKKLDRLNRERQDLTQKYSDEADLIIKNEGNKKVYFIVGDEWPEGIVGLIAGKLSQKHYRPVLVASKSGGHIKGSARSIESFNIANVFKELDKYLLRHGGHAGAAGFQLDYSTLFEFKEALEDHVNKNLSDVDLEKILLIDSYMDFDDIDFSIIDLLLKLEPFGHYNPDPVFAFSNIMPVRTEKFGSDKQHFKFFTKKRPDLEFIGFNNARMYSSLLSSNKTLSIAGMPGINEWNGNKRIQIKVRDIKVE